MKLLYCLSWLFVLTVAPTAIVGVTRRIMSRVGNVGNDHSPNYNTTGAIGWWEQW